jgi:hypothetical protein
MADSILIQFRVPKKYADSLVRHTNELSETIGYEITPSSFVKSQTMKWMTKQFDQPKQPERSLKDYFE